MRLIAGVDPVSGGRIEIDGHVVTHCLARMAAVQRGIAFVPEDRKGEGLVLDFSVAENLALPNLRAVAREYSLSRAGLAEFAREQIRAVDIRPDNPNRAVATLSGGNQQKTAIGKWLSRRPRLLIVDEPTRGVDVGAKAQIYALLADLAADGMAILMVSSELPEVLGLSDRIVVFHERAHRRRALVGGCDPRGRHAHGARRAGGGGVSATAAPERTVRVTLVLEYVPYVGLVALFIAATIASSSFLSVHNLLDVAQTSAVLGFVTLGSSIVLLSGNLDLSVGAIMAAGRWRASRSRAPALRSQPWSGSRSVRVSARRTDSSWRCSARTR